VASGVLVTSLVQSSSAVTVATIGFVNAGLLTLAQAVAVTYGSNIGTTATGWLIAVLGFHVNVKAFALPLVGVNIPARELSGDFYDYFRLPDGRIYFTLADVAGKGTNAALLMVKTGTLFRSLGKRLSAPEQLLRNINDELCETATRGMFVTMIAGVYDPQPGELRMVNAGHPPALLLAADGRLRALAANAPPLGILPGHEYTATTTTLGQGALYLFSDGVIEGRLADGRCLGLQGLVGLLLKLHALPRAERLQTLVARLQHQQGQAATDDMTLLLLEEDRDGR